MNDITALAQREMEQREKFEAWTEESCALPWGYLKKRRTYDGFYSEHTYTSLWAAWKAASMALVEALEAKQPHHNGMMQLSNELAMAKHRIAELENDEVRQRLANSEHQLHIAELAKHNLKASRKAQFRKRKVAERRIAELESRTVTVKLPQRLQPGADGYDDWYVHSAEDGEYLKADDVIAVLAAAGIQVIEGEGQ